MKRARRLGLLAAFLAVGTAAAFLALDRGRLYAGGAKEAPEATSASTPPSTQARPVREAMYWEPLDQKRVQCLLCFRQCVIPEGKRGFCGNRVNQAGILYSLVFARPSALQIDPVEKEPQHHYRPGTRILCFGTAGCNFRCRFCQNWHLSQRTIEEIGYYIDLSPQEAVREALSRGIPSVSFTYNEPTVFYEYVYEVARLAKENGLGVIFHSNGSMNPEPLKALLRYVDAVTIDLKGFSEDYYRKVSEARLEPVLRTLKIIREQGVWLEIVNLVVPTLNDDPRDIRRMCRWIRDNLGAETPLHFSRFFPAYRLTDLPPTPVSTLERAHEIAREEGLKFVSIGNVPGHPKNSTFCPQCGGILIERYHFAVHQVNLKDGRCRACGYGVPGVWK